jgi:phosphatidylserine decarboxylase
VKRGDDLGTFKFGGSTVITVWQKGAIAFDPVSVKSSAS